MRASLLLILLLSFAALGAGSKALEIYLIDV